MQHAFITITGQVNVDAIDIDSNIIDINVIAVTTSGLRPGPTRRTQRRRPRREGLKGESQREGPKGEIQRDEHDDEDDDCGDGEASRGRTTTRRHRIKQAQCLASQRLPPSASVRCCLGIQGSTTLAGGAPMGEVPNGIKLGSSQWDAREDAHLGKKAIPAR